MSTQPNVPDHPHQPSHPSTMTAADWAEDVAFGVMLLSGVAILVVVLAVVIFV